VRIVADGAVIAEHARRFEVDPIRRTRGRRT